MAQQNKLELFEEALKKCMESSIIKFELEKQYCIVPNDELLRILIEYSSILLNDTKSSPCVELIEARNILILFLEGLQYANKSYLGEKHTHTREWIKLNSATLEAVVCSKESHTFVKHAIKICGLSCDEVLVQESQLVKIAFDKPSKMTSIFISELIRWQLERLHGISAAKKEQCDAAIGHLVRFLVLVFVKSHQGDFTSDEICELNRIVNVLAQFKKHESFTKHLPALEEIWNDRFDGKLSKKVFNWPFFFSCVKSHYSGLERLKSSFHKSSRAKVESREACEDGKDTSAAPTKSESAEASDHKE